MIKRDYYRLSELPRHSILSIEDYQYFVENFKETLFFRVHDQPIIIVEECRLNEKGVTDDEFTITWEELEATAELIDSNKNIHYQGLKVGRYSGLVRLSKEAKNTLLREQEVNIHYIRIDDIQGLKHSNTDYPYETLLPNDLLECWSDEELLDTKGIQSLLVSDVTGTLQRASIKVCFNDLFIPSELIELTNKYFEPDVQDIDNLINKNQSVTKETTQVISSTKEREADFGSLVRKIVSEDNHISGKEAWAILESEVKTNKNERLYDQYNILTHQIADEIFWNSRYGNAGSQKFGSFHTTLSRVKKKVNTV